MAVAYSKRTPVDEWNSFLEIIYIEKENRNRATELVTTSPSLVGGS